MSPLLSPAFSVTRSDASPDWLVAVGEIDLNTAQTLSVAIELAERRAPPQLTVELSDVTFIDVSGLRVLLQAARRARTDGRRFAVARPSHQVARLLELTAISQALDISDAAPPAEA